MARPVIINDCTLREGEQAAGVNLDFEAKCRLARALVAAGVRHLQVGYPGRSTADETFARWISGAALRTPDGHTVVTEAIVQVFLDDWREQIDRALATGVDWVVLMFPASDLRLTYVQRTTRRQMLQHSTKAVRYAVGRGCHVRFSPTDTTRAHPAFLRDLYRAVVDAGAERVTVADTAGAATPEVFAELVSQVREWSGVPVHIHCHNDFGLALANTLAGVRAGAASADATLGGLGERAGNAPLEQLAVVLELLYGAETGIELARLTPLVRQAFAEFGLQLPPWHPVAGRDAFAHKLDAHVLGVLRHPMVYEALAPEQVGNTRRFPLGKYSGEAALRARLGALGLWPEGIDDPALRTRLARLARCLESQTLSKGGELSDEELVSLWAAVDGEEEAR
ncbi:LeuA family protein [Thermaerobacter sp. FW80]|uniref:LeuA family protein n=1 Tax=Thermaerobacter sp. FW80 TaxID=2546351 RepID=UPI00142FFBBA|nr:hypothetical protein [Thermaerobacter sp. FW80]